MNWSRRKPGTMNLSPQKKWSLSECPLSASAIFVSNPQPSYFGLLLGWVVVEGTKQDPFKREQDRKHFSSDVYRELVHKRLHCKLCQNEDKSLNLQRACWCWPRRATKVREPHITVQAGDRYHRDQTRRPLGFEEC